MGWLSRTSAQQQQIVEHVKDVRAWLMHSAYDRDAMLLAQQLERPHDAQRIVAIESRGSIDTTTTICISITQPSS